MLSLGLALIGSLLLVSFGCTSVSGLWTGVAAVAAGSASIYACTFGFVESCFAVSPLIGSVIVMSAITGESLFPVLIAPFVESDPQVLMYVVLSSVLIISLIFSLMTLARRKFKHRE